MSTNNFEIESMEERYECRLKLYRYYIENQNEFKKRPTCVKEAVIDYSSMNDLPMPNEWLIELDQRIICEDKETVTVEKITNFDKSMNAYDNALRGAWDSYTEIQKEYVLNFAISNSLFIPRYWKS